MKTVFLNAGTAKHDWVLVDATDKTLGRLATKLAMILRGKHKAEFTPNADTGDYVVVINAEKVRVTGNKLDGKRYWRHTEYPGGIKSDTLGEMLDKHPERVLEKAVKGMLPKGPLGYAQFRKLKVYAGDQHPHAAQQPKTIQV
ncbi:MAG TPA: 50S ribosomal protein L13 [Verrucomicrobiae bacterium]|nr:50S ribosomal protein L13 [Verrucomicrobiae bacterium]